MQIKNEEVIQMPFGMTYHLKNGKRHRLDGPAMYNDAGYKAWWVDGKLHREDGPAIIGSNGYKAWWIDGKQHREDGPAVICSTGYKAWYLNDKRHRQDGPSIEYEDGYERYHINGVEYSKEQWEYIYNKKGALCGAPKWQRIDISNLSLQSKRSMI